MEWSPTFTDEQLATLTELATTFALAHGLLYLPPSPPPIPESAIHAPISLVPSPFPRQLFRHAQRIQALYGKLYARVAMDEQFLDEAMGAERGAGLVDEFTRQLWQSWKKAKQDGGQNLQLGLFRSDYLLHHVPGRPMGLKQVEFNTISSSFGPLSCVAGALHKYLLRLTGYYGASPLLVPENLPENRATEALAEGLATAHAAIGRPDAWVLFVVQDRERNVFDQRVLEYDLLQKHGILVIRQTMKQLLTSAKLDGRELIVTALGRRHSISVIYFRATYTPTDYPSPEYWEARVVLERSDAIKCPSLPLQLAGGKKVQQVLTTPGMLERFIPEATEVEIQDLKETWVEMWALDDNPTGELPSGFDRARQRHEALVLKPQREGGGNNVYKQSIPPFLDNMPVEERKAWIAMELIKPPESIENWMVKAGSGASGAIKGAVISELGVFSWTLFGNGQDIHQSDDAGWLLRTKGKDSDEGGVAVGFSVLDSVVLVD